MWAPSINESAERTQGALKLINFSEIRTKFETVQQNQPLKIYLFQE
jgi:hypothetical protein